MLRRVASFCFKQRDLDERNGDAFWPRRRWLSALVVRARFWNVFDGISAIVRRRLRLQTKAVALHLLKPFERRISGERVDDDDVERGDSDDRPQSNDPLAQASTRFAPRSRPVVGAPKRPASKLW